MDNLIMKHDKVINKNYKISLDKARANLICAVDKILLIVFINILIFFQAAPKRPKTT